MRRSGIALNVFVLTVSLTAGLAGCESVAYVRSQLEEIPMPSPALMQPVSETDCTTGHLSKGHAKSEKDSESDADGGDFERLDAVQTKQVEVNEEKKESSKGEDTMEKLKADLNCYRNAADQMRRRLKKLQASAAETVNAVTTMKNKYQDFAGQNTDNGIAFTVRAPENY